MGAGSDAVAATTIVYAIGSLEDDTLDVLVQTVDLAGGDSPSGVPAGTGGLLDTGLPTSVLLATGRAPEAEAAFRRALAAGGDNGAVRSNLGVSLDLQGRHAEAQQEYRTSLARAESNATRVNLGLSLALAGQTEPALQMLHPPAGGTGAPPRARHNLAVALTLAGKRGEAESLLRPDMSGEQVRMAIAGIQALQAPQR